MIVSLKHVKINSEIFKKALEIRPLFKVFKSDIIERNADVFKCYSDVENSFVKDYAPLSEQDYERFISNRAAKREPAITRQVTSLAYKVGKQMISLAEGMPNEAMFPFSMIKLELNAGGEIVLEGNDLSTALQYVPSQGLPALVSELRQFQAEVHRPPPIARDIIVTNGAQHGIYKCVELLVEPGDAVLLPEYAYSGMHVALKPYRPEILTIPEDQNGLIPETLEYILENRLSRGLKMPKLLYVVPTGSNPTGTVIPEHRRRRIYELACRYDFLILEDDPYMFLNYTERQPATFLSLDACGRVLRLDSTSKLLCAGLRAAWLTAPAPLLQRLELHGQAAVLHSCSLGQSILHRLISDRDTFASHARSSRAFYRRRRDALHDALHDALGASLGARAQWTRPDAGLFFWLKVHGVDDVYNMVFRTAFERGLMLVPGQAFMYDTTAPSQHLRLTFSKVRYEDMSIAARHLADIIEIEQRSLRSQRLATH